MTKEFFKTMLMEAYVVSINNPEEGHIIADKIIIEALREEGFDVETFKQIKKWYC